MAVTNRGVEKRVLLLLVCSAAGHVTFAPEQDGEGLPKQLEELDKGPAFGNAHYWAGPP